MKYGIFIIVLVVSSQLYSQSARMSAGAFQAYNQYAISSQSSVAYNSGDAVTTTFPSAENSSLLMPKVRSSAPETTCDVVVQEELVAGRMVGSGDNANGFNAIIIKIKNLFRLR